VAGALRVGLGQEVGAGPLTSWLCRALISRRTTKAILCRQVLAKTHGKDLFVVRFLIVHTTNKNCNNFIKFIKNIK
jgi:hypothetical protein